MQHERSYKLILSKLEMVQMQLKARFGNLPDWAMARLRAAGTEELTRLGTAPVDPGQPA